MQSLYIFFLLFLCYFIFSRELDENLTARNTRRRKMLENTKRRISSCYGINSRKIKKKKLSNDQSLLIRFGFISFIFTIIKSSIWIVWMHERFVCIFFREIQFPNGNRQALYFQFIAFCVAHPPTQNSSNVSFLL